MKCLSGILCGGMSRLVINFFLRENVRFIVRFVSFLISLISKSVYTSKLLNHASWVRILLNNNEKF